jgi:hypothetical protein
MYRVTNLEINPVFDQKKDNPVVVSVEKPSFFKKKHENLARD